MAAAPLWTIITAPLINTRRSKPPTRQRRLERSLRIPREHVPVTTQCPWWTLLVVFVSVANKTFPTTRWCYWIPNCAWNNNITASTRRSSSISWVEAKVTAKPTLSPPPRRKKFTIIITGIYLAIDIHPSMNMNRILELTHSSDRVICGDCLWVLQHTFAWVWGVCKYFTCKERIYSNV